MFLLPALTFSISLVVKSLLDCFIYPKRFTTIVKKLFCATIFTGIAFIFYQFKVKLIPSFTWEEILISGVIVLLVLFPKPSLLRHSSIFGFFKNIVYFAVIIYAISILALSHYKKLVLGSPFMVIRMTGEKEKKPVSVLPALGSSQEMVDYYHVLFETTRGEKMADAYLYGDLVGVRVKTLHFSSWLSFFGFEPCYRVDMVYNGFMEKSLYSKLPLQIVELESKDLRNSLFDRFFLAFWNTHFYEYKPSYFIKTAALQSQYFPLFSKEAKPFVGSFELSLYSSGIGGKKLESR